jgi:hypothetical protein
MPSKTPAKKSSAKPAKKATKTAKVAKAASKAPSKKASKKASNKKATKAATKPPRLPEGVTMSTLTVTSISNVNPVNLTVQDVRGTPYVYYGTLQISDEIDDVFDANTTVTTVNWVVTNGASYDVEAQFGSAAPILLTANGGSTTHPMTMPAQGQCTSTTLLVWRDGQLAHDPVIKIKRKDASGRIPSC